MFITLNRPVEVEVDAIRVEVAVRNEEEDMPNDFPFREGDMWDVTLDLATKKIRGWPQGRTANLHMKVVDSGNYYLMAADRVESRIMQDYVPSCIPGEYGDYIVFNIGADGTLIGWEPLEHKIAEAFFPED